MLGKFIRGNFLILYQMLFTVNLIVALQRTNTGGGSVYLADNAKWHAQGNCFCVTGQKSR